MPVAVLYKAIAVSLIRAEKFYKTVAVLFIRVEKLHKPIATYVIRVEKLYKPIAIFVMATATLCIARITVRMQTTKQKEQATLQLMARTDCKTRTTIL